MVTLIRSLPDTAQLWFENRTRRQKSLIALLQSQRIESISERKVLDLLVTPEKGASQFFIVAMKKREAAIPPIILAIDLMLTTQQREYLMLKLEGLIQEIEGLTQKSSHPESNSD
ncbi:MAG: hypothetical protein ACPGYT_06610 [Nitrospirales bacterium]